MARGICAVLYNPPGGNQPGDCTAYGVAHRACYQRPRSWRAGSTQAQSMLCNNQAGTLLLVSSRDVLLTSLWCHCSQASCVLSSPSSPSTNNEAGPWPRSQPWADTLQHRGETPCWKDVARIRYTHPSTLTQPTSCMALLCALGMMPGISGTTISNGLLRG